MVVIMYFSLLSICIIWCLLFCSTIIFLLLFYRWCFITSIVWGDFLILSSNPSLNMDPANFEVFFSPVLSSSLILFCCCFSFCFSDYRSESSSSSLPRIFFSKSSMSFPIDFMAFIYDIVLACTFLFSCLTLKRVSFYLCIFLTVIFTAHFSMLDFYQSFLNSADFLIFSIYFSLILYVCSK